MPTLYRVCRRNPPSPEDLMSHEAQGKQPPRNAPPEVLESWERVSTLTTKGLAREIADEARLGEWVATLEVPESVEVKVGRPRRSPGRHVDLIGTTPEQLRGYISRVDRI